MGILSLLFWGAASVGLMARDEIKSTNNINRNYARMQADGCDRQTDYGLEEQKKREARIDWEYGDKKLYPKRLWPFFEQNICARIEYGDCIARVKMLEAGYRPVGSPCSFRLSVYNPFATYEFRYANAEKAFFRTQEIIQARGYAKYKCSQCDIEWNPKESGDVCPRCGFTIHTEV